MPAEAETKPAETSITLEVAFKYGGAIQFFPFASLDAAIAQLEALAPKIGAKYSNDPDNHRHRIVAGDGEAVIDPVEVASARVTDNATFRELTSYTNRRSMNDHVEVLTAAIRAATAVGAQA